MKLVSLIEALKSGRPIRRPGRCFSYSNTSYGMNNTIRIAPDAWLDPKWFLETVHLAREDIVNFDWEIKPDPLDELNARIDLIMRETGIRPRVLDVPPTDFQDIYHAMPNSRDYSERVQGCVNQVEFRGVRIVKGRARPE